MKRKIILSYDYELFFGLRSGTVQKSIIEPTNRLLNAMDANKQKGNFFVDYLMLKYLKEVNTPQTISDLKLIENQLIDIVRRGHRVELHIHPHWVDAKYNGDGTWDFSDYHHYSLCSFEEKDIIRMFVEGVNLLTDIVRVANPQYNIVAFRAGGWTVQPFIKLKQAFKESGIKVDSSVSIGSYNKNRFYEYDFRNVNTTCKYLYRFSDDITIENPEGDYMEAPISSYHRGRFNKFVDAVYRRLHKTSNKISDGTHQRNDIPASPKTNVAMLMMSWMSPFTVLDAIRKINSPILVLIDHPKDYSPSNDECLKALSKRAESITYLDLL